MRQPSLRDLKSPSRGTQLGETRRTIGSHPGPHPDTLGGSRHTVSSGSPNRTTGLPKRDICSRKKGPSHPPGATEGPSGVVTSHGRCDELRGVRTPPLASLRERPHPPGAECAHGAQHAGQGATPSSGCPQAAWRSGQKTERKHSEQPGVRMWNIIVYGQSTTKGVRVVTKGSPVTDHEPIV